jgi:hypothetical protein
VDSPLSTPPPGASPAAQPLASPRPAGPPAPQPANRRELDSRRVVARLIDGLVAGAPVVFVALGVARGLEIFLAVAWSIGAIAFAMWPRADADYRAAVDSVCASRIAAMAATPPEQRNIHAVVQRGRQDRSAIAAAAVARASAQPDPGRAFEAEVLGMPACANLQL